MFHLFGKKNKKVIETHAFFNSLKREIQIHVDQIVLPSPVKQRLVRAFLKIVLQTYHDQILQYVKDGKNFSDSASLERIMNACYVAYHEESKIEGIPTIFIDRFDQYFRANFDITTEAVKQIGDSQFYHSDAEKMAAVLDALTFSFRIMIINVEKSVGGMNGELETALKGTKFDID